MKELLTASRMAKVLTCPRAHFWAYEVGLRRQSTSDALRFGSAWHRAMEVRAKGGEVASALAAAVQKEDGLEPVMSNTLAGLLYGYYAHWGPQDGDFDSAHAEVEFCYDLPGSRSFRAAGKIDLLGVLKSGVIAKWEHKTTADSIEPDSEFWLRLRFNPQVLQYVCAARKLGWAVEEVIYDVVKKPAIQPKTVNIMDELGRKIVLDSNGQRVLKQNGEPRESGDTEKGWVVQTRLETPEEFGDRLYHDTQERPHFYFARRNVPILDQDLEEFEAQRIMVSRMILGCRAQQRTTKAGRGDQAWPRNIGMACGWCEYQSFCLQNINVDLKSPPAGFVASEKNSELTVK
jgi:hypothetical protein